MTPAVYIPDAGDITWFDMNPRTGHEQSGRRPCLVVSPRLFTERTGLAIICPVTSRVKGLPYEIVLDGTTTQGAILPIHVRSIDVSARYPKFIETASPAILSQTRQHLRVLAGID